ncbi:MAG TPA: dethiobiotin synthase [Chthoniobacterales bacterium]
MSIFVTGTDTGVGKTSFTVWLLRQLRERGIRCAGYKPICCGDRDDAEKLHAAGSPDATIDEVNPVWLRTPTAPLTASRVEKCAIDLPSLRDGFDKLSARFDFVAVEGVGGWMVPITTDYFSNHLAEDLGLPVLVVAQNRLGCLNHILLTIHAVQSAGLRCVGVVLNDFAQESDLAMSTNAEILKDCLTLPVITGSGPGLAWEFDQFGQMLPEISALLARG